MRIDRIEISNFKAFANLTLEFDECFTLLAGLNGSGKTSILEAISIALGLWHHTVSAPGGRSIGDAEIHHRVVPIGDTVRFVAETYAQVTAYGVIDRKEVSWTRLIRAGGLPAGDSGTIATQETIQILMRRNYLAPSEVILPIIAFYSVSRLGPSRRNQLLFQPDTRTGRERIDAYFDSLDGKVTDDRLIEWFLWAAVAAGQKMERAGYYAVRQAVMECLPDCSALWFDAERREIVADLGGKPTPYYSLSAGQRILLAVAADIAIKAETLNPQLGAEMVKKTPGVVLIDELDLHLHPAWQRRVVADLQRAFPAIQFICTSHSPQIFGELPPENILVCDPESGQWFHPARSFGLDSSRVLEEEMNASARNPAVEAKLGHLATAIDEEKFQEAEKLLGGVVQDLGEDDPEVTRARTLMTFLQDTE